MTADALANDGIHLPVTHAGLALDNRRTLLDGDCIDQRAAAAVAAVALFAPALTTQILVEIAA